MIETIEQIWLLIVLIVILTYSFLIAEYNHRLEKKCRKELVQFISKKRLYQEFYDFLEKNKNNKGAV